MVLSYSEAQQPFDAPLIFQSWLQGGHSLHIASSTLNIQVSKIKPVKAFRASFQICLCILGLWN
jgi:hypothetical protein